MRRHFEVRRPAPGQSSRKRQAGNRTNHLTLIQRRRAISGAEMSAKEQEGIKMYEATIYKRKIRAKNMPDLKRKASRIANGYFRPVDEMEVLCDEDGTVCRYARVNRAFPNNTIQRGTWR